MGSEQPPFTLAIIGAGIGGLALAIGLLKQGVPCTVYEAAPKFDAIGAGIGLGPNALRAMELMDDNFARLYDKIKVGNTDPKRAHEQIECLYAEEGFGIKRGWKGGSVGHPKFERSSAHRKALLEVMKSLIPEGTVHFNRKVSKLENVDGKALIQFEDGEKKMVDIVIGCDGIKGMSRRAVLESRYPEEVASKYCNTYVFRGIVPMEEAKEIMGSYAEDARWYMSKGRGWAMYPITMGREANFVAFVQDENDWTGEQVAREVTREEMLSKFTDFDSRLVRLLDYAKPLKWPLFHHPDTPTYFNGRICMLGDCAHASSPNQAAGAGQGLEDAFLLSRLLGLVKSPDELDAAIEIYDSIRRPRAQSVVRGGREAGIIYFLSDPEIRDDMQRIVDDANRRLPLIWWHDLEGDSRVAEERFKQVRAR